MRSCASGLPRLIGALIVALGVGASSPAAGDDAVLCPFTEEPITVDGVAKEAAWKAAQAVAGPSAASGDRDGQALQAATRARLLWTREDLHCLIECDGVAPDDCVTLVLRPDAARPEHYRFRVSMAGGVTADLVEAPAAAGVGGRFWAESATGRRDAAAGGPGWTAELRIPWIAFFRTRGRPDVGAEWSVALGRGGSSEPESLLPLRFAADPSPRPFGIAVRPQSPAHRVQGSPDPPPPYVVEPAFPQANLKNVIFVCPQPGSDRLLFISDTFGTTASRIRRIPDRPDATADDVEILLDDSHASRVNVVHYAIAFHPRFAENGYIYVGCNGGARKDAATDAARAEPRTSRVLRYRMDPAPPWRLDPASETEIIAWPHDGHNGGAVAFGNDGMLYVTTGDGSYDSDAHQTGQDLSSLNAKVLRIDVDHPDPGKAYSVPKDNPFVGLEAARPETWAYGMRNPWRMDVDRETGDVWVGNNGQDQVEQVYLVERGANYGWSAAEGSRPFVPERKAGPSPISPPTCEHDHSEARSLTGGIVCRGMKRADLEGEYVYGDHVTGRIWSVPHDDADASTPRLLADTRLMITSFARNHAGDLLVTDFYIGNAGGIYRLVPRPPQQATAGFPLRLSDTGLFASVPRHELVPGAIPYGVNAPQWADGAEAVRYVVLPETMRQRTPERGWFTVPARMGVTPQQGWTMPDGTVVVQSLAMEGQPGDPASRRWIETRILLLNEGDWAGYTYRWSDDQQDAELVAAEGLDAELRLAAAGAERVQRWRYPSRAECLVCHSQSANFVLGLSTVQLNRDFDYHAVLGGDAATDNQLRTFEHLGLLEQDVDGLARERIAALVRNEIAAGTPDPEAVAARAALVRQCTESPARKDMAKPLPVPMLFASPARLPRLVDPRDGSQVLARRVRSYLHANCSSCHIAAGGGNSRIHFDFRTPLERMQAIDEKPMHATFAIDDARIVAPGAPDRSILWYRLSRRGPAQMPPLCSTVVDEAAVRLVREWIESLQPAMATAH
jgi:glucose/arabinose dehydrogenase/mono/diheme cytochrome c family protein